MVRAVSAPQTSRSVRVRTLSHHRRTAMRHLSAVRDIIVPIAGILFFVLLLTLAA